MNIDHPFHFDALGAVATTTDDDHVRDLLEQLLLTSPGERVNRPDFGCGLLARVFEPNNPELVAAAQYAVTAAIQRWLGDLIEPHVVEVQVQDAVLAVTVRFAVRRTGEVREERFRAGVVS